MITIHTHITNPLYFLIIKLYKVILYFIIHANIHTNNIVTKINKQINNAHNQYRHAITQIIYKFIIKIYTLTTHNGQIEKRDS